MEELYRPHEYAPDFPNLRQVVLDSDVYKNVSHLTPRFQSTTRVLKRLLLIWLIVDVFNEKSCIRGIFIFYKWL